MTVQEGELDTSTLFLSFNPLHWISAWNSYICGSQQIFTPYKIYCGETDIPFHYNLGTYLGYSFHGELLTTVAGLAIWYWHTLKVLSVKVCLQMTEPQAKNTQADRDHHNAFERKTKQNKTKQPHRNLWPLLPFCCFYSSFPMCNTPLQRPTSKRSDEKCWDLIQVCLHFWNFW